MNKQDKKIEKGIEKDLETSFTDGIATVAKSLPIPGSSQAAELWGVFGPTMEKRQNKWLIFLHQGFEELSHKVEGLSWKSLIDDPQFFDVMLGASRVALQTHQEKKLDALRNTVLNTVLHKTLSEDKQMMFISYVDDLTPSHLQVLSFLNATKEWAIRHNPWLLESPGFPFYGAELIERAFPEFKGEQEMCASLIQDLITRSLLKPEVNTTTLYLLQGEIVNPNSAHALGADIAKCRRELVTKSGKEFLAYISFPLGDETMPANNSIDSCG